MPDDEKTIKVSASGYAAMMAMRDLLKAHGLDAIPPEFVGLAEEELAQRKGDDAYPRGAVQSIAARVGLAVLAAHARAGKKAAK